MLVSHTKPCDPLTGAAGSGLAPEKSPHRQGGLERHEPSTSGPDECLIGTNVDCGRLPTLDTIWTAASVAWDEVLNPSTMDRPNLRIQFDFYHNQIVGGDLLVRFEKYFHLIGHVQIAAVPSRHEPDEGEINYPAIFAALDRLGYDGFVGCEYKPWARTEDGLGWAEAYGVTPKRS